jgi:hypothetical protein
MGPFSGFPRSSRCGSQSDRSRSRGLASRPASCGPRHRCSRCLARCSRGAGESCASSASRFWRSGWRMPRCTLPSLPGTLGDCWRDQRTYSHGLLVPLLVWVLARQRRPRRLRNGRARWRGASRGSRGRCSRPVVRHSWSGAAASEWFTLRASGVLVVAGLCGILGGPLCFRRYGPPLLLLLGTIPVAVCDLLQNLVSVAAALGPARSRDARLLGLERDNATAISSRSVARRSRWSVLAAAYRSMMALTTLAAAAAVALRLGVWRGALPGRRSAAGGDARELAASARHGRCW